MAKSSLWAIANPPTSQIWKKKKKKRKGLGPTNIIQESLVEISNIYMFKNHKIHVKIRFAIF
jgi:hypothetical protein